MSRFILASESPQRRTLLEGLKIPFEVIPSDVEEQDCVERDPGLRARVLAEMKAGNVAAIHPDAWVLGCDTLVVAANGTLLEKPQNALEAHEMIALQSGKTSLVHSGICLFRPDGTKRSAVSTSSVTFRSLSKEDIAWWVGTALWQGRSGAFQIDGLGQLMIERIEGDWTGVVGLPVFLLGTLLREAGFPIE
ncbi:MAG: nucleoside triphosphate pyrophosphatase [Candidatus Peregrinibacteria bacterium]